MSSKDQPRLSAARSGLLGREKRSCERGREEQVLVLGSPGGMAGEEGAAYPSLSCATL